MQEHSHSRLPVLVAVVVVLLVPPVLYVLATGPAQWLVGNGYISHESTVGGLLMMFYWPLGILHESSEPVRGALDWYLAFWE